MTTMTSRPEAAETGFRPVPGAQELMNGKQPAAPGGWFSCTVNLTGPAEDGTVFIHLREETGKFDRWYSATPGMKREMLATALAAISAGRSVSANLTTTDEYGVVNRLYVRAV